MAKSDSTGLDRYVLRWMSEMGERIGADRVGDALSGAMLGVAKTKAVVDRNVASLLSIANIPSRSEYQRMLSRVEVLQSRVVDLGQRLDQLTHDLAGANGQGGRKKKARRSAPSVARSRRSGAAARKRRGS